MQFGLNESQKILKENARQFFAGECPMTQVRQLAESKQPHDPALWSKMAAQGYTGIIFPEKYDGLGLGTVELILLMEEAGRALLPGPFWSTVALAGTVIDAVAGDAQKAKYLARICRGEARSTLALLEAAASWDLADAKLVAANGRLTGEKLFVLDADVILQSDPITELMSLVDDRTFLTLDRVREREVANRIKISDAEIDDLVAYLESL